MRLVYQIAGIAFLLLGAFLAYHAAALRYYTPLGPGPGFFPRWLCGLLIALALVVMAQATLKNSQALPEDFVAPPAGRWRIVAVLCGLVAVAVLLPILGFRLTMLAFIAVTLSLLGPRPIVETALLALLGSFGIYELFVQYLSLPLPIGRFGV